MRNLFLIFVALSLPAICQATIMACADEIEAMKTKKEKEGLGILGEQSCKDSPLGKKARYKVDSPWKCSTLNDFPCVEKKQLKMVQCDRAWECY